MIRERSANGRDNRIDVITHRTLCLDCLRTVADRCFHLPSFGHASVDVPEDSHSVLLLLVRRHRPCEVVPPYSLERFLFLGRQQSQSLSDITLPRLSGSWS